jgi:hypothetical protein
VIEYDRIFAFFLEVFVEHIQHFQEGHMIVNAGNAIGFDFTLGRGTWLAPDFEGEVHGVHGSSYL